MCPEKMFNRYPEQARARKGYALVGVIFLIFGMVMMFLDSGIGMLIGSVLGTTLLVPSLLFDDKRFDRVEKVASRIAVWGNFS